MPELTEKEYRAIPALSGTGVARLLASPADYRHDTDHPREQSPAMRVGSLVHALVLDTPVEYAANEFSYKTERAAWDARKKEIRESGLTPIPIEDFDTAKAMAEAVLLHKEARALLEAPGASEVEVSGEHRGARLKGRIDRLPTTGPVVDLKTARDHTTRPMERFIGDYGTATQLAHYALLTGREEHRPLVIAVRNTSRPAVAVYRLAELTWDLALAATKRAWDIYADCIESGEWPDPYAEGIGELQMTPWAMDALDDRPTEIEVK